MRYKRAFKLPDFANDPPIALVVRWPRRDRRERHQGRADLAAQTHQPVPARQHPVHMTARMREPMAPIAGPTAANLEQLVSDALAGRANKHLLRQMRVTADRHGLITEPDFSGLVCEAVAAVWRLQPRRCARDQQILPIQGENGHRSVPIREPLRRHTGVMTISA